MITPSEATLISAAIGALGYAAVYARQKPIKDNTKDTGERVARIEAAQEHFMAALDRHTEQDDKNFAELRQGLRPRRRGWLLPGIALLVRIWPR